ncbi:hypothetical protein GOBAR_AA00111 [Gossypium barbadense]|uniref:Uncharacterized protein n=1 Tax=Gossypium barbadense TaxID=3634 RepID=A0A2P5YY32_GOSBA|nr:hypothetical protein GOBAR_AA00111 [Gossypium barbadense]
MSSSRGKKAVVPTSKKRKGASSSSGPTVEVRHFFLRLPIGPQEELFQILRAQPLIVGCCIDWATTMMMNYDDPDTNQFFLGGLVRQLNVLEFGTTLGLYTEKFKEKNDLHALNRRIYRYPSRCWDALVPYRATYNPSRSKASALPPSLRYLHAILAHTITGRRESTSVTRWSGIGKGSSPLAPMLLGISSMLSMRMIEKCRRTYPSQYRLTQCTEEEAYEDIPDDVPSQHKDPPSQPPPPFRPVHVAALYANISECLTRFEQQCFQRFDNIDATLQQICQHLYISSSVPPREPSSDEDV